MLPLYTNCPEVFIISRFAVSSFPSISIVKLLEKGFEKILKLISSFLDAIPVEITLIMLEVSELPKSFSLEVELLIYHSIIISLRPNTSRIIQVPELPKHLST